MAIRRQPIESKEPKHFVAGAATPQSLASRLIRPEEKSREVKLFSIAPVGSIRLAGTVTHYFILERNRQFFNLVRDFIDSTNEVSVCDFRRFGWHLWGDHADEYEIGLMSTLYQQTATAQWHLFKPVISELFSGAISDCEKFVKVTQNDVVKKLVADCKREPENMDGLAKFYSDCTDRCHFTWFSQALREYTDKNTKFVKMKNSYDLAVLMNRLPPDKKSLTEHLFILYRDLIPSKSKFKREVEREARGCGELLEYCVKQPKPSAFNEKMIKIAIALLSTGSARFAALRNLYREFILIFNSSDSDKVRERRIEYLLLNTYLKIRIDTKRGASSRLGDALRVLLKEQFNYDLPKMFDQPMSGRMLEEKSDYFREYIVFKTEIAQLSSQNDLEFVLSPLLSIQGKSFDEYVEHAIKRMWTCVNIANDSDPYSGPVYTKAARKLRELLIKNQIYVPSNLTDKSNPVVVHVTTYLKTPAATLEHKR